MFNKKQEQKTTFLKPAVKTINLKGIFMEKLRSIERNHTNEMSATKFTFIDFNMAFDFGVCTFYAYVRFNVS